MIDTEHFDFRDLPPKVVSKLSAWLFSFLTYFQDHIPGWDQVVNQS